MAMQDNMEEIWGVAAAHAEHRIQDRIRYQVEGRIRTGTILWICTSVYMEKHFSSIRYIVRPDECMTSLDLVWPGNVLIEDIAHEQNCPSSTTTSGVEQELLAMLATLSVPIHIRMEIDDGGQPFYVWHIGEATPQHPFGLYRGVDRLLIGAMKQALERFIKHLGYQE